LLTNALASARVQKLKINFGEDSTERGFMYQSTHNVTISDPESAVSALDFVDAAAKVVNESRARMGATMSRIEFTINNLMNVVENTEEAKSRVLDTDYAKESAELAKAQILAQAGTAMLAQANQSQQYVLNLLRQG
jgi:flagellin